MALLEALSQLCCDVLVSLHRLMFPGSETTAVFGP